MTQSMMRVSELMTKSEIDFIGGDSSIRDAAKRMKEARRGCLVVIEQGRLIGILTERDLVQRVVAEDRVPIRTPVSDIMSKPVISIGPEALVSDAAKIMTENKIRRLPVTENLEVIGMLTVTDFAKFLHRKSGQDPMLAAMARAAVLLSQTP